MEQLKWEILEEPIVPIKVRKYKLPNLFGGSMSRYGDDADFSIKFQHSTRNIWDHLNNADEYNVFKIADGIYKFVHIKSSTWGILNIVHYLFEDGKYNILEFLEIAKKIIIEDRENSKI